MGMTEGDLNSALSVEADSQLHRLWESWRQQNRPDFPMFGAAGHPLSSDQILALLRLDQHERWRAGDRLPAEAYVQTYRLLREDPEAAFVLIYSEFLLRQELGENLLSRSILFVFRSMPTGFESSTASMVRYWPPPGQARRPPGLIHRNQPRSREMVYRIKIRPLPVYRPFPAMRFWGNSVAAGWASSIRRGNRNSAARWP
jgi:hypothetical protein